MEIRKVKTDRDIDTRETKLHMIVRGSAAGHYTKEAMKKSMHVSKKGTKNGIRTIKNAVRSKDIRKQLKILTPEQRKQWNSYSFKKQTQILEKAQGTAAKSVSQKTRNRTVSVREAMVKELKERAAGANGGQGDQWDVTVPKGDTVKEMKKNLKQGEMETVTFYSDNVNRGSKQVKKIEGKYNRALKAEKKENTRQYRTALLTMIDKEINKSKQIKAMQQADQISQMETENAAVSSLGRHAAMPLRAKIQAYFSRIGEKVIRKAGSMLLKFALPIILPLILLFFLLLVVVNITGGSSESGSGAVQAIGGGGYSATGEEIVEYALQWLGTPYVWGGTDLNVAVDCSGYTSSVYAHFNILIPRIASAQGNYEGGQLIESLDQAVQGDLIWWTPEHVGIYIGDGKAVQSSGGPANYDLAHAGLGVSIVQADYRNIGSIRRFVNDVTGGNVGTGGHSVDPTDYTQDEIELIWAVVAQEDNASYEGALAVISCAMNRVDSPAWQSCGGNSLQQLKAPGQFCYSIDLNWIPRLGGNVPAYVKQAVSDCLERGIRNHSFCSFRSTMGSQTGGNAVQIGGNWFF